MADIDEDELLADLGIDLAPEKVAHYTPQEERIIAGFEDILRFYQTHGRAPQHSDHGDHGDIGNKRDIFERLYAVRLEQLRQLPEAHDLLAARDSMGLLQSSPMEAVDVDSLDEDTLLSELGGADTTPNDSNDPHNITVLRHVRSSTEIRAAAEEIANRTPCADFEKFKPQFEQVERELKAGIRKTLRFGQDASIECGDYFILGGQLVYVADVGATARNASSGHEDGRLRVIYGNGTESNLLMRSLQKALYKDEAGRRLTNTSINKGSLFGDALETNDVASGTIYVLRSLSPHPYIAQHRELIHKIGVTGGKVEKRIAGAKNDATYLLADVEVVATYQLRNLNRFKLEAIFHRLFSEVQIDLTIEDRFGNPVKPREWFFVPLPLIDEAVKRILDESIGDMEYDKNAVKLVRIRPRHMTATNHLE